jgi:hypothetical protein
MLLFGTAYSMEDKWPYTFARREAEKNYKEYVTKPKECFEHKKLIRDCGCWSLSDDIGEMYGRGFSHKKAREKVERKYEKLVKKYTPYEGELGKKYQEYLKKSFWIKLTGGVHYFMTFDEIVQKIKSKFVAMAKNGLIIRRKQFEEIKKDYFTEQDRRSVGYYVTSSWGYNPFLDLCRIWAAEYINYKRNEFSKLKERLAVPDYIIVVPDDAEKLKICVSIRNNHYPVIKELENANVYFKKISGKGVADGVSKEDKKLLDKIRYKDFKEEGFENYKTSVFRGTGNIIEKDGKLYIVDLERRSFTDLQNFPSKYKEVSIYFNKKFELINKKKLEACSYPDYCMTVKLPTEDLIEK